MKSRLNCLLFSKKWPTIDEEQEDSSADNAKEIVEDPSDALWDKLPVLGSKEQLKMKKTKKRKFANELSKEKIKKSCMVVEDLQGHQI